MSKYYSERGVALILVLWVTVLLTVMAGGFIAIVRTEARGVANYKDESQAYFLARSAVVLAIERLIEEKINTGLRETAFVEERWILDGTPRKVLFGDNAFVELSIIDESGKVDINSADKPLLDRVCIAMEIEEDDRVVVVASILDWLDENNFHRLNGAEDDFYGSLREPYESKDGPMSIIEELLWVRGVTPELFYGESGKGQKGAPFGEEKSQRAGLANLFTVYTDKAGININTAPFELLLALPGIDSDTARKIIDTRIEREFKKMSELAAIGVELSAELGKYITFTSAGFYTVQATGGFLERPARYSVKAVVEITNNARYRILYWKDRETVRTSLI
ncbi:MAG: helix-hairpin-helix domain-containing protein [Thermodesulfobacteriota bacterium]